MTQEDERILKKGPLPCIWKNYANKLICTPGCGNYEEIKRQLIEAQKRTDETGRHLSIAEMIEGIRTREYGIIEPDKLDRRKCREQPRIPVTAIGLE